MVGYCGILAGEVWEGLVILRFSILIFIVVNIDWDNLSSYSKSEFDKENLLESSLDFIHYLYMFDYLSLFTDLMILHN